MKVRRYKTERRFMAALRTATANGTLLDWWGEDHGWALRVRP